MRALWWGALISLTFLTSCFSRPVPVTSFPMPSKDDVARVDGERFSIELYLAIRARMAHPTQKSVLWAGTTTLSLMRQSELTGHALSLGEAMTCALYSLGELPMERAMPALTKYTGGTGLATSPQILKESFNQLVARVVVQKNPQILAEFP